MCPLQVAKLTGHSYRVLYLAMSPDGESIVTGAGDETLRLAKASHWSSYSNLASYWLSLVHSILIPIQVPFRFNVYVLKLWIISSGWTLDVATYSSQHVLSIANKFK